jgi:hypothetical protein
MSKTDPAFPVAFPPSSEWLRSFSCTGTFEAHLTVQADSSESRQQFVQTCQQLGIKSVLIELAEGEHASQPMTATFHHGNLQNALMEVESLYAKLWQGGFPVARVKLEAVAMNSGVPEDSESVSRLPSNCYFEFHAKLLLPTETDLESVQKICFEQGARLSRNARRVREDGQCERFVTQRVYGVGREEAFCQFESLMNQLKSNGFVIVNQQREFTLYDSEASLDAGWIDPPDEEDE